MELEKFNELQSKIKKGSYYKMVFKSIKEIKGNTIEKVSNGVYRFGINYKNISKVKDITTHSLLWGEWQTQNFILKHKETLYLRVYPSTCKYHKTKSFYLLNGKETTKQELIEMGLLKEQNTKEMLCFNIKLENLISIETKD